MKKKIDIKRLFNKYLKYVLIILIIIVVFHNYLLKMTLFLVLTFMGVMSLRASTYVPHISIETISASAVFFGFIWGWKMGLAYGVVAGLAGYIYIGLIKLTTLTKALLMGLAGVVGSIFAALGFSFIPAFMLTFLIMSNFSFFVFSFISSDMIENITHAYGDSIFSVIITMQVLNIIYIIIQPLL